MLYENANINSWKRFQVLMVICFVFLSYTKKSRVCWKGTSLFYVKILVCLSLFVITDYFEKHWKFFTSDMYKY